MSFAPIAPPEPVSAPALSLGAKVARRACYCGHQVPHREVLQHWTITSGSRLWVPCQHCAYCGEQLTPLWGLELPPHVRHHRCSVAARKQEGFAFSGAGVRP
jgi:hypothetical protein